MRFWRIMSKAPLEMVEETAKFLSGQREAEPAITLIAERLGFITPQESPHIDPGFLNDLTDRLPPLEHRSSRQYRPQAVMKKGTTDADTLSVIPPSAEDKIGSATGLSRAEPQAR